MTTWFWDKYFCLRRLRSPSSWFNHIKSSIASTIPSCIDPGNRWLSPTAWLPEAASPPGSCHQFHLHLLLHCPAHGADRQVCADRIWEVPLPVTHHLHRDSNHRHHLLYPFMDRAAELTVLLWLDDSELHKVDAVWCPIRGHGISSLQQWRLCSTVQLFYSTTHALCYIWIRSAALFTKWDWSPHWSRYVLTACGVTSIFNHCLLVTFSAGILHIDTTSFTGGD